jgi:regulatory protein
VNARRKTRRTPSPLDSGKLDVLALIYVGRFATTRAKLRSYLARKLRERGWEEQADPDLDAIAERLADQGYIDDAGYALAKSRALSGRGYGKRRVMTALRVAGVAEEDGIEARDHADSEAVGAALRFAERRRLGPFALTRADDPRDREKALATMIRAGHGFALARAIVELAPGAEVDLDGLAERAGLFA